MRVDALNKNIKYVRYVLIHKWYVFLEACKLGIPWRGLMHDLSKFSPDEWRQRVKGSAKKCIKKNGGTLDFDKVDENLKTAWLKHYRKNPHHWQWWVTFLDSGNMVVLPMSEEYKKEMLADWIAVSKMPDRVDIIPWYVQNKDKIHLHPETREWIEVKLGLNTPVQ